MTDIDSTTLIVHRAWNDEPRSVTLRLAYSISVSRGALSWNFIVDADTGALIAIEQLFAT